VGGDRGPASIAQLTTARNRVASDATDLGDGLDKAFANTRSETLGAGLTRQLDEFRTAVDAVAPSDSLLAPAPERSLRNLAVDQNELQRTALALQRAALGELDVILRGRESDAARTRTFSLAAAVLAVLLVVAAAVGLRPAWQRSGRRDADPETFEDRAADPGGGPGAGGDWSRGRRSGRHDGELVGAPGPERAGGGRAPR
jgi:hypothetical protein